MHNTQGVQFWQFGAIKVFDTRASAPGSATDYT